METKELDKIYSQLQARCAKCNNPITSIAQAKSKKDKDGNSVVLCLSCAEACQSAQSSNALLQEKDKPSKEG